MAWEKVWTLSQTTEKTLNALKTTQKSLWTYAG
jgi:hypothetical protein